MFRWVLIVAAVTALAGCGPKGAGPAGKPSITGSWITLNGRRTVAFEPDGTFVSPGNESESGKAHWRIEGGTLVLTWEKRPGESRLPVWVAADGRQMTLDYGAGGIETFRRP